MWYKKSIEEITRELGTDVINGLTSEEASVRIKKYGENKLIEKKKKSILKLLFEQINDVLIYILLAAAVVSAALGEISDAIIIMVVVVLNAVIGLIQESKAEKALDSLKNFQCLKHWLKEMEKL
ncbi:Calcium-transporting ATPase 1 [Clostridium ljungdahlii]|uniref:Calcium-transporting ATPase 1 n=1 Tax=Clostridium ljungdahlii TaxID=1538 RepID=A0A168LMH7_9CLOT|nr:Calcium-transporting ATPase 1 [Clostridium ljungdahlii]